MAKMNQMYMNVICGVFGLIIILMIIFVLKKSSHMESFSNIAYACNSNIDWDQGVLYEKDGDERLFECDKKDPFYYTPSDTYCPRGSRQICMTEQGFTDLKAARVKRNLEKKK